MSETLDHAQRSNKVSAEQDGPEQGLSMSPPAFQLKAGDDAPEGNGDGKNTPRQLKAPGFGLSASPAGGPESAGGEGDVISKMGNAMGADFSGVKISTNSAKATDMGALAYAQGEEVHFAPGQYNPNTTAGQELIGHELSHVVQQREGRVQANTSMNGMPVNDDGGLEKEADDMGRKAAAASGPDVAQKKSAGTASKGAAQAKVVQKANNPITSVIAYIQGEMATNFSSAAVAYIKYNLAMAQVMGSIMAGAGLIYKYNAYKKWYDMVRTGGPWDHKRHLRTTYGQWSDDAPNNLSYGFDIWSNIHYGFIGRECGFDEWTLLAGAGAAQVMAGTVPPGYWSRRFETLGDADFAAAFDDPKDQAAIRVGFRLWSSAGAGVTTTDILTAVRAVSSSLNTQAMPSGGGGTVGTGGGNGNGGGNP